MLLVEDNNRFSIIIFVAIAKRVVLGRLTRRDNRVNKRTITLANRNGGSMPAEAFGN